MDNDNHDKSSNYIVLSFFRYLHEHRYRSARLVAELIKQFFHIQKSINSLFSLLLTHFNNAPTLKTPFV